MFLGSQTVSTMFSKSADSQRMKYLWFMSFIVSEIDISGSWGIFLSQGHRKCHGRAGMLTWIHFCISPLIVDTEFTPLKEPKALRIFSYYTSVNKIYHVKWNMIQSFTYVQKSDLIYRNRNILLLIFLWICSKHLKTLKLSHLFFTYNGKVVIIAVIV
jgi:hypothetical protein